MSKKKASLGYSDVIEEFITQYKREYDYYCAASSLAAQLIETQLINKGIRAIVTFRAKDPVRLRDKVIKRSAL